VPEDFQEKVLKWETALREKIAKKPERRAEFTTVSELPIDRVCWPWSAEGLDPANDLGIPGSYPFTRGVQPNMYRGRVDHASVCRIRCQKKLIRGSNAYRAGADQVVRGI
jgi:methylmalonyl-CoA mutase N-terminal domain/subunit